MTDQKKTVPKHDGNGAGAARGRSLIPWLNWDDPNVPVGDAPRIPRWPMALVVLAWLAWVIFLLIMLMRG